MADEKTESPAEPPKRSRAKPKPKAEAPAAEAAAKPAAEAAPKPAAEAAPKKPARRKAPPPAPVAAPPPKPRVKAAKPPKEGGPRVKVTQIGSPIGRQGYQRSTLKGLGLNKMHRSRVLEDTPSVRGMIASVRHLLRVEAVS